MAGDLHAPPPGLAYHEPISPELVLVDPDLARIARELLPDRHDWTIDFEPRPRRLPEPVQIAVRREPTASSAFVRATQIGAALLLAFALFGALGAEGLRRSSPRVELAPRTTAPQPTTPSVAATPKRSHRSSAPVRTRAASRQPISRSASRQVHKTRRALPSRRASEAKSTVARKLTKRAIGKQGTWSIRRLGRPTSVARQDRTCQMRWVHLRLTLIVRLPRSSGVCSQGTVVATIRTPDSRGRD